MNRIGMFSADFQQVSGTGWKRNKNPDSQSSVLIIFFAPKNCFWEMTKKIILLQLIKVCVRNRSPSFMLCLKMIGAVVPLLGQANELPNTS